MLAIERGERGGGQTAGETDWAFWTQWACVAVQAVVTSVAAHAAGAGHAWGATDSNLLLDVPVKLIDAREVAVEIVNLVRELVEFFDDHLVAVLRILGQHDARARFQGSREQDRGNDKGREGERSNRRQPSLLLVGRVPIHDLIGIEVQRGGRTYCHGRSTLFQWVGAWAI